MKCLLYWVRGNGGKYNYLSKVSDNYELGQSTPNGIFMFGYIQNPDKCMEDFIIKVDNNDEILTYSGYSNEFVNLTEVLS